MYSVFQQHYKSKEKLMTTASNVANTFILLDDRNDGDGLTNLKLQKLAYYAQGFYLAIFDTPLFDETIEAWTHGPVVPDLYQAYKQYGRSPVPIAENFDINALEEDEINLIEEVYRVYGQFSAWQLRDMTHEEAPWINNEAYAEVIPVNELTDFFRTRLN